MNDADWEIFGDDLPEPREQGDPNPHRHDGEEYNGDPTDMQRLSAEIFLFDKKNPFETIIRWIIGR